MQRPGVKSRHDDLRNLKWIGLAKGASMDIDMFRSKLAKMARKRPRCHLEASQRHGWTLADHIHGRTRTCPKTVTHPWSTFLQIHTQQKLLYSQKAEPDCNHFLPDDVSNPSLSSLSQVNSCSDSCPLSVLNHPSLFWSSHLPL